MDVKVKTERFASQLRTRLAQLTKARPGNLAAYHAAVPRWRLDLARWIQQNGGARILAAAPEKKRNPYSRGIGFDTNEFFRGAPKPPEYPDDTIIREIRAVLRQLGITGQATVTVSTEDVARLLGDNVGDD